MRALTDHEQRECDDGGGDRRPRLDRRPTGRTALDHPEGEERQRQHAERLTRRVKAAVGSLAGRRQITRGEHQAHGADRHVDEEHGAPADQADERPAEDRPRRGAGPGNRAPHPEGPRPFVAAAVHAAEQRQRTGDEQRRAEPLQRTGGDQDGDARGGTARQPRRA